MESQTPENLPINSSEKASSDLVDTINTLEILANPRRQQKNLAALRKFFSPKP